ncbi:sugar transferase [Maritimibacter sp. DP1N21-5]|uniref:sugar transferase n=1 Tax=Maritimibacter sp. DP1N21-5 TaxID=2836867 RepID=UPI001C450B24|nr:sugar transferase [Maritimibacter sp. DP1N21-5]MBV7411056.1 sugar transferase [Maritimibacter sp. DP1N21-5]
MESGDVLRPGGAYHDADLAPQSHLTGPPIVHNYGLYSTVGKRALDLLLAGLMLPVVLPIVAILWALTRRDGGVGFFSQPRIGRCGREFRCWKIRTMVPDAEARLASCLANDPALAAEWRETRKLARDPRITPLGHFLRRSSLDELPQIWNVIRGDMSFVGPRPVVHEEIERYGRFRHAYFSARPGITGLWQVSGRNRVSYAQRVQFDVDYVSRSSLLLDLTIILRTAASVVSGTGQ